MNSGNKRVFRLKELPSECFGIFKDMRRKGEFCDLTIKFGNHSVSAHRIVVAAVIPYFRGKLSANEMGKDAQELTMPDTVDPSALECLIGFAYTHEVEITPENVKSLLSAASALKINEVVNACSDLLAELLCAENVLSTWELAEALNCSRLKKMVDDYIRRNFDKVASTEDFLKAPIEYVKELTGKEDLQTASEEMVFEFVMRWVKKEPLERKDFLPEILSNVRLKLLSPHYLVHNVATEELIKCSLPCRDVLDEARNYYVLLFDRNKDLTTSRTRSESCHVKKSIGLETSPSSVNSVTEKSVLTLQYFAPEKEEWVSMKTEPLVVTTGPVIEVSGKMCYIDRGRLRVYSYSSKTWSMQDVYAVPRFYAGAAVLDNMLYLCGGRDADVALNVVERFDAKGNFKRSVVACMSKSRNLCGVVSLGEYIYAIGGQDESGTHDSVEKYNPSTNRWTTVSPMLTKRYNFGCAALNGKIYVCGGSKSVAHRKNLSSAEVYDPVEDRWQRIAPMETARQTLAVRPYCGKLYAVSQDRDGLENINATEVYDPEKNKWCRGHPVDRHEIT